MDNQRIADLVHGFEFTLQHPAIVDVVSGCHAQRHADHRFRFAGAIAWRGKILRVEHCQRAHHIAHVPSRINVVADVANSVGPQQLAANTQNVLAHRRRHPRIQSMGNDVVELAELAANLRHIALKHAKVLNADFVRTFSRALHRLGRKIKAHEF